MASLSEIINDINQIDLSGRSGVDANWPRIVKPMQALLALYQSIERAGSIPTDHISSIMLGDGSTRKLRRIVYVPGTTTVKVQKNTGSDVTPVWTDLISIDASGNLTVTGSLVATLPTHISTHLPGASDPIPTAIAVDVAASNGAGSGTSLALANHTHKGIHSVDHNSSGSPFYGDINLKNGNKISLSGAGNEITFNLDSSNQLYVSTKNLGSQVSVTSTTAITGLTNLSVPGANGTRQYRVFCTVCCINNTTTSCTGYLGLHIGTTGTISDSLFYEIGLFVDAATVANREFTLTMAGLVIQPTSSQKVTMSFLPSPANNHTIVHGSIFYCTLLIQENI